MRQTSIARVFLIPGTLWLVALFLVPLGLVVGVSLATTDVVGRPVYGLHFENYHQVFQSLFIPVFLRSLEYALATTVGCLAIGYPTAYTIARFGGRYRNMLILLVILPWFVDYLVRIYAWFELLGQDGLVSTALQKLGLAPAVGVSFLGTSYAVVGGLIYSYLPYMILAVYVAVESLDPALIEAGKDLYGTPRATFLHVTLPNTLAGVVAGCILVFLPASGDFATAQFLGGPEQSMIGNLVQSEMTITGAAPLGAGLTVVLVVLLAVVILGYMTITRGRGASLGAIS
jgi:spermidine/putrescine transport system permease protein